MTDELGVDHASEGDLQSGSDGSGRALSMDDNAIAVTQHEHGRSQGAEAQNGSSEVPATLCIADLAARVFPSVRAISLLLGVIVSLSPVVTSGKLCDSVVWRRNRVADGSTGQHSDIRRETQDSNEDDGMPGTSDSKLGAGVPTGGRQALLADPTGCCHAFFHDDALALIGDRLVVGAAVALGPVRSATPRPHAHVAIIAAASIRAVFPPRGRIN